MADEKGFFTQRNLDVTIIHNDPGNNPFDALSSGTSEFCTGFLTDAMVARDGGLRLRHLAQYVNRSTLMLAAWRHAGITEPADLNDRKVSVWPGNFQVAVNTWFNHHNVQAVVRPQYYSINLFLRRGVDACCVTDYNEYHQLYLHGVDPAELTFFRISDAGLDFPEDALFATEDFVRGNPEITYAMREAIMEGWQYAAQNRDETVDVVLERLRRQHLPANPILMKRMLDSYCKAVFPVSGEWKVGTLAERTYNETGQALIKYGKLNSLPSYETFVEPHP